MRLPLTQWSKYISTLHGGMQDQSVPSKLSRNTPTCTQQAFLDRLTLSSYVRNLEERLRALERSAAQGSRHEHPAAHEQSGVEYMPQNFGSSPMDSTQPYQQPISGQALYTGEANDGNRVGDRNTGQQLITGAYGVKDHAPNPVSSSTGVPAQNHQSHMPVVGSTPTFADELRTLTLEATAERHLGSTSGLPFAKLTEKVLRRLSPDKADFVFLNYQETTTGASLFNLDSPADLFGESVLRDLSESISIHPVLFGDLFLADFTESDSNSLDSLAWPSDEAHVKSLVDFYFAHSHTLYPMVSQAHFMQVLERIRARPQSMNELPPLDVFRLWMVLAIGSTACSSISLTDEAESRVYYSKALQYLETALGANEMSALEVIMLQVSYSFFNQLGPNTWFLVGTAARLALGMGLHTNWAYSALSPEVAEQRKRVFFSIYMMDRVVSVALGRPFAINDDDVDIDSFSAGQEGLPASDIESSLHFGQPSSLVVPHHILALRRIASKITTQVYSIRKTAQATDEQREEILSSLHRDLLQWRQDTPFPLPDLQPGVPHLTSTWYDLNYYTHLAMIYRPSPLCPVLDVRRIKILESAASMSIRQAYSLHQQRRLAYNWLTFLTLFTSTISLVYAVTAQPEDLAVFLKETRAIDDLDLVLQLFETLGVKFLAASKIQAMVGEISRRYKIIRDGQEATTGPVLP